MSGIEKNSGAGAAQPAGTGDSGKPVDKLRDVSADEANRFSGSFAKKGDGKAAKGNGSSQQSGETSGLPRPQSRGGEAGEGKGAAKSDLPRPQSHGGEAGEGKRAAKSGLPTPQAAEKKDGATGANAAQQKSEPGERGLPDQMVNAGTIPQQQTGGGAAVAAAAAPAPEDSVSDLASKLANKILASKPESGVSEVRIELNMNKLQGTVITLRQDANGLNIVFDSPSPEVTGRLVETRGDLVHRLQAATGENVTVDISDQEADQDRQPGDGRSRNQYDQNAEEEELNDA